MIVFISLFSCTDEVGDLNTNRTIEEVRTLIQTDPQTTQHTESITEGVGDFLNYDQIPDRTNLIRSIDDIVKEEVISYYNQMLESYPELTRLSVQEQLEVIYNVDISTLNQTVSSHQQRLSGELRGSSDLQIADNPGPGICYSIGQLAIGVLEMAIILDNLGLDGLADSLGGIAGVLTDLYLLCTSLSLD